MRLGKCFLIILATAFALAAQTSYTSLVNQSTGQPYSYATNIYLGTSDFTVPAGGPMIPNGIVCRDSGTISVITITGDSCKLYAKPGLNWFPVQVQKIISSGTDAALRVSSIILYGTVTSQFAYASLVTPVAPTLSTPTNGSTNQPHPISLAWSGNASNYNIYISTSSAFSNTISTYSASRAYLNSVSVPSSSTLYWRVSGSTVAGSGPWSSVWNFGTTL